MTLPVMSPAVATKTGPRFACVWCGKRSYAEDMIYSSWTKNRYCASDPKGKCRAAHEKAKREAQTND